MSAATRFRDMLNHAQDQQWILAAQDACAFLADDSARVPGFPPEGFTQILSLGISECLRQDPNPEDLLRFSNAWLKVDPGSDKALGWRGMTNLLRGDLDQALADLSAAIERNKDEHSHYAHRGQVFESLNDWQRAEEDYARSVQLNPGEATIQERWRNAKSKLPGRT